jgi:hypothetical protein
MNNAIAYSPKLRYAAVEIGEIKKLVFALIS